MSDENNDLNNTPEVPQSGSLEWLEQLDEQQFDTLLQQKAPREAAVYRRSGMSRRTFLQLMGASLAVTGLASCSGIQPPGEEVVPYVRMPEEIVPGQPLYFATTTTIGGYATGLLIETHEGRPTRVEGNPNHPASLGSVNTRLQASMIELYNPNRSTEVLNNGQPSTWSAFQDALREVTEFMQQYSEGAGLRILTETVTSPTLAKQIEDMMETYPGAKWYQYEPVARDNVVTGARLAFDQDVNTYYRFDQADVVLSLDGDFLTEMPGNVRYARDFISKRKVREGTTEMNRLYAVESTPTNTGAMADHRLTLRAGQVELFTRALANELGIDAGDLPGDLPWDNQFLSSLVADLQANRGASVVVPGDEQSPAVHALVHAINIRLNNVGSTVMYTEPVMARPTVQTNDLSELIDEMNAEDVEALVILGGNPSMTAPADSGFNEALDNVPFSVHLSLYNDETSTRTNWHVPSTHYIEEWSDARAFDGTASLVQPPIGPLYDTVRSPHQMIAALVNDDQRDYDRLRNFWQEQYDGADFEAYWRRALHDGVLEDNATPGVTPQLRGDFAAAIRDSFNANAGDTEALEVIFRPDPNIWDGRFANNSWLQEVPHPMTLISWDNAALINEATAEEMGLESEDLIELRNGDYVMEAPVWITPGQPDNTVTVFLGYGQGMSADVEAERSFNAYAIRTAAAPWHMSGVEFDMLGEKYTLARSQAKDDMEDPDPVRTGTLGLFLENPEFAQEEHKSASLREDYDYGDGYAWGMSIDLTSCIGCNACTIACQMENNNPTVGKEEMEKGRDLFWIRIDRYNEERPDGSVRTLFQPVPCMHCEQAPCEQVCPVQATVHDHEGLNLMVYNRCIGTRYCSANCPYNVRRFNFLDYIDEENITEEWRNPDVSVRTRGVMEKCTYCIQRINEVRAEATREDRDIQDGEIQPACASACPTQAIHFGNLNDPEAEVTELKAQPHDYGLLAEVDVKPRTTYLARLFNPNEALHESGTEEE